MANGKYGLSFKDIDLTCDDGELTIDADDGRERVMVYLDKEQTAQVFDWLGAEMAKRNSSEDVKAKAEAA